MTFFAEVGHGGTTNAAAEGRAGGDGESEAAMEDDVDVKDSVVCIDGGSSVTHNVFEKEEEEEEMRRESVRKDVSSPLLSPPPPLPPPRVSS